MDVRSPSSDSGYSDVAPPPPSGASGSMFDRGGARGGHLAGGGHLLGVPAAAGCGAHRGRSAEVSPLRARVVKNRVQVAIRDFAVSK